MKTGDILKYLKDTGIRFYWEESEEKWYLVVNDVLCILGESKNPQAYWRYLKQRLQLSGEGEKGAYRRVRVYKENGAAVRMVAMDFVLFFRIVPYLRSPAAEKLKLWLAEAGNEQLREIYDPERSLERALDSWRKMGRDEKWILQRMMSQETRHRLTEYWGRHGIKESGEFRALTNLIHQAWSELTVQEHKMLKGLRSQNLRDHMTESELIFMALAEMTARLVAESYRAEGLEDNMLSAVKAGEITRNTRKELESVTGLDVLSPNNFLSAASVRKKKPDSK